MLRHNGKGLSMDTIRTVLGDNPEIGFIGSIIAFLTPFIDAISPFLQLISIILGIGIAYVTFRIQLRRWTNLKERDKREKVD